MFLRLCFREPLSDPNENHAVLKGPAIGFRATDGQIGPLVYELYGLTEEEIRIVEGT